MYINKFNFRRFFEKNAFCEVTQGKNCKMANFNLDLKDPYGYIKAISSIDS